MIKSNTKTLDVKPLPVTTARYKEFAEWREKCLKFVSEKGNVKRGLAIIKLTQKYPDLLGNLIDKETGQLNEKAIEERAAQICERDKVDLSVARELALAQLREKIQLLAIENEEIFNAIVAPELHYPSTVESITFGIDLIRATCDKSKLTKNDAKLLDDTDFWENAEWEGVADYANFFLQCYS
jgi:hypothetical protein